ncbi:MAG: hypothetical protein V4543_06085 [Bacteroidota bacterium]
MTYRKILVSMHTDGSGGFTLPAIFHQWSSYPLAAENGISIGVTLALVEFEDGSVEQLNPNRIKFTDKPKV